MDFHSGDSAVVWINKDEIKLTNVASFQNLSVTNFFFLIPVIFCMHVFIPVWTGGHFMKVELFEVL